MTKSKSTKGIYFVMSREEKDFLKSTSVRAGMSMSDFIRFNLFRERSVKFRLKAMDLKVDKILKIVEGFE
jgi:hypothetical protein